MSKDSLTAILSSTLTSISEKKEFLDIMFYSILAFIIPFLFKRPIELIFMITNIVIFLTAFNIKGKKIFFVVLLPAVGAFIGSSISRDMTFIIPMFIPIIWVGEAILVFAIKWLYLYRDINFFLVLFIAATTKYLFLTVFAYIFIMNSLAPPTFMLAMGKIQLIAALIGGAMAYFIVKINKK